ncbi:mannan endo-1,4-beta-mannosidase 5-like [Wolffia australiana]
MARLGEALLIYLALVLSALVGSVQSGFVKTNGAEFVVDGAPFLFNGFNAYWLLHVAAEPSERSKVSDVLGGAAAGLGVCRTWAFSDGGDKALQISPGVYDESVFQGLDFVISEAGKKGIRLILSLVNNFDDFGGRGQYVQWARNEGVSINCTDDFYTNPAVKGYYKNHVEGVFARVNSVTNVTYKDDPTIMAWELINEPRCEVDSSGGTIHAWVEEMAAFAKSLDSNHLLEVGMEGFYGDSSPDRKQYNPGYQVGTDFIRTNQLPTIDFATIHAYPDIWLSGQGEQSQDSFVQRWMWSHWHDATSALKKPLVFAEFGMSKKDPGYTTQERDAYIDVVYDDIYGFAKEGGAFAGGLVWQLMAEGMDSFYDGYEIVLSKEPETGTVLARQSRQMNSLRQTMAGISVSNDELPQRQEEMSSPPRGFVPGRRFGAVGRPRGRSSKSKK